MDPWAAVAVVMGLGLVALGVVLGVQEVHEGWARDRHRRGLAGRRIEAAETIARFGPRPVPQQWSPSLTVQFDGGKVSRSPGAMMGFGQTQVAGPTQGLDPSLVVDMFNTGWNAEGIASFLGVQPADVEAVIRRGTMHLV